MRRRLERKRTCRLAAPSKLGTATAKRRLPRSIFSPSGRPCTSITRTACSAPKSTIIESWLRRPAGLSRRLARQPEDRPLGEAGQKTVRFGEAGQKTVRFGELRRSRALTLLDRVPKIERRGFSRRGTVLL